MSDDLNFSFNVDDILSLIFYMPSDEELAHYIPIAGKSFTPTVVSELPATGDESDLYLVPKSYTSQTASGNPITVNITDGAGKLDSAQLDGDTYQQSYTGKNLFNYTNANYPVVDRGITATLNADGSITVTGVPTASYIRIVELSMIDALEDGATYTISSDSYSADVYMDVVATRISDGGLSYPANTRSGSASFTVNKSTYSQYRISINTYTTASWGGESKTITRKFQLEKSSSATSWEKYVGGVPSPSPSYPQNINVVTGTQTVSVNGTNYTVNLGDIELCKLGTYQDYIYKSGSDWKVHKAIGAITVDGSEGWAYSGDNKFSANNINGMAMPVNADAVCYCSTHIGVLSAGSGAAFNPLVEGIPYAVDVHRTATMVRFKDIRFTTTTELKSWLSQNNTTIYYVVATPTDTTITDQTLITQLEAIAKAALQSGSNTISNTASGTNLAGDLDISYHGYDPLNKYNKYIWINLDGAYEQL